MCSCSKNKISGKTNKVIKQQVKPINRQNQSLKRVIRRKA